MVQQSILGHNTNKKQFTNSPSCKWRICLCLQLFCLCFLCLFVSCKICFLSALRRLQLSNLFLVSIKLISQGKQCSVNRKWKAQETKKHRRGATEMDKSCVQWGICETEIVYTIQWYWEWALDAWYRNYQSHAGKRVLQLNMKFNHQHTKQQVLQQHLAYPGGTPVEI